MAEFETVAVPMRRLLDGRDLIADADLAEQPEFREFVDQFSNYWRYDEQICGYVSPVRAVT